METGYDVISTIQELQDMWCKDLEITYSSRKGRDDKLDRETNKYQHLNILVDEMCDDVRASATGIMDVRGSCSMLT
jgi:hypothetical protein